MPRSSRRRRLTALLLLLWQGAVLAPGAVAAQQLPAGESQSVAQSTPPAWKPATKGIPAEVEKWFADIASAADKGDLNQALSLYERVLGWVETNLPEKHLIRALLMIRETLDNPANPRDNRSVISWRGWVHGRQAARIW